LWKVRAKDVGMFRVWMFSKQSGYYRKRDYEGLGLRIRILGDKG